MSTYFLRCLAVLGGFAFFDVARAIWTSLPGSSWGQLQPLVFVAVYIAVSWGLCFKQHRSIAKLRGQVEEKVLDQLAFAPQLVTLGFYMVLLDRVLPALRH